MHSMIFAAATFAALTLFAPTIAGSSAAAGEVAGHRHAPDSPRLSEAAMSNEGAFDGIVIERTIGDAPAETFIVNREDTVRLILHAAPGTELHLHGYDLVGTAGPEAPVVMTFVARHPGRFAVEAHGVADVLGRHEKAVAYIEVRP